MNRSADDFGGTLDNRLRFPLAVVAAVRAVISLLGDLIDNERLWLLCDMRVVVAYINLEL